MGVMLLITGVMLASSFVVGKKKVKTPSVEDCVDTLQFFKKEGEALQEIGALGQKFVAHGQAYTNKEPIVCLKTAQQRQEFSLLVNEVECALDLLIEATKNLNKFINVQEAKKAVMQN